MSYAKSSKEKMGQAGVFLRSSRLALESLWKAVDMRLALSAIANKEWGINASATGLFNTQIKFWLRETYSYLLYVFFFNSFLN
ncbi:hypothetical protein BCU46_03220 [Enterovibrio norvegicus]|nr:hypothetical protein BCU46_03220 [Enterovibrio norvegicus]